jgi:hypothetical protein
MLAKIASRALMSSVSISLEYRIYRNANVIRTTSTRALSACVIFEAIARGSRKFLILWGPSQGRGERVPFPYLNILANLARACQKALFFMIAIFFLDRSRADASPRSSCWFLSSSFSSLSTRICKDNRISRRRRYAR